MSVQPLQSSTPITIKGDMPSAALVMILQQMARELSELRAQLAAMTP